MEADKKPQGMRNKRKGYRTTNSEITSRRSQHHLFPKKENVTCSQPITLAGERRHSTQERKEN